MNSNDKIIQLQREIEAEKAKMNSCNHIWGDPFSNPETIQEGYGSVQDGAGSDPHWSYEGYRPKVIPRWTRKCTLCGKEEHTYKTEAVISSYKPRF